MHECSTMDVIESVLNGYSGIGVLHFSASESALMKRNFEIKKLSFRQIGSFRPYVCLSKDHPLLQSGTVKELDVRDLLSEEIRVSNLYNMVRALKKKATVTNTLSRKFIRI